MEITNTQSLNSEVIKKYAGVKIFAMFIAQVGAMTSITAATTVMGLLGLQLASSIFLTTLPSTLTIIALALSVVPVGHLIRSKPRQVVFIGGTIVGLLGCILAIVAVVYQLFVLLLAAAVILGIANAVAGYYRFAAAALVANENLIRIHAAMLGAGLVAGFLGPYLLVVAGPLIRGSQYAGVFLALGCVNIISFCAVLIGAPRGPAQGVASTTGVEVKAVPLGLIFVGGAITAYMSMIMTAAPLAMHHTDLHATHISGVMQGHFIGMFAPALFVSFAPRRLMPFVLFIGVCIGVVASLVALTGNNNFSYFLALTGCGIAWSLITLSCNAEISSFRSSRVEMKYSGATAGANAIASLLAGVLVQSLGWIGINALAMVLLVLILGYVINTTLRRKNH